MATPRSLTLLVDPQGDGAPADLPLELLERAGVRSLTYLQEVGSTNSYALGRLASHFETTPWLILAEVQTLGRGRGENRWWSEEGSLTFSLVVEAADYALPQVFWPRLSMGVGLAICQLLERAPWHQSMQLKWPNDVYLRGKKLGGILIEHLGSKLVIGVGLNVNQQFDAVPSDVKARATSLLLEMGMECSPFAFLVDIVQEILATLNRVGQDEVDFTLEAGDRNYLQWKRVLIRQGMTANAGTCEGIDFDGALLVRTEVGLTRVLSGTVEISAP